MKKTSLLLAVAALLSSSALSVLSVNADDTTPAGKTSVAEFNVEAGNLELVQAPDMLFNKVDFGNLVGEGNATTKYASKEVNKKGTGQDSLEVHDFRGTDANWKVSARVSSFTNGLSTLNGTITFNGQAISKDDNIIATSTDNASEHYIYKRTPDSETTTLELAKKTSGIKSGQYDADITWTLSDTASGNTAAEQ